MKLLNKQKALLFECIKESEDFDPTQFELIGADSDTNEVMLKLRGTEYYCSFWYERGYPENGVSASYAARICPAPMAWEYTTGVGAHFENLIPIIVEWLTFLKEELDTPDPWLSLQSIPLPEQGVATDSPNSPFTYNEWEHLAKGMEGIRSHLLQQSDASQEAHALINERVNKLIEDGKYLGRKDWFNQAIGMLAGVAITIGSQPEVVKGMWQLLKAAVNGIVRLMPILAEGTKHIA